MIDSVLQAFSEKSPVSTTWGTFLRFWIGSCNLLDTLSIDSGKQVKISAKLLDSYRLSPVTFR